MSRTLGAACRAPSIGAERTGPKLRPVCRGALPPPEQHPPPGVRVRPATWADLDRVVELLAGASRARTGAVIVRREDLRMRWLGLTGLEATSLVEAEEDGELLAYAAFDPLPAPWAGELELHLDVQVHPAATGRGLASHLFAIAEARARDAATAHGLDRARLQTTLTDGDDHARAFVARRGYTATRHLLELRLDLHAPPPGAVWPVGVTWRSLDPERDARAVWQAHQAAFADVATHLSLSLDEFVTDRLRPVPASEADLQLIAEHGDQIIAVALCRSGTGVAAEDGWVRDLGVVPNWRRRGVGMALLREAFARFRGRGLTGVGLEVDDVTLDGAVALYRRAGMRIVRRTDVYERVLTGPREP